MWPWAQYIASFFFIHQLGITTAYNSWSYCKNEVDNYLENTWRRTWNWYTVDTCRHLKTVCYIRCRKTTSAPLALINLIHWSVTDNQAGSMWGLQKGIKKDQVHWGDPSGHFLQGWREPRCGGAALWVFVCKYEEGLLCKAEQAGEGWGWPSEQEAVLERSYEFSWGICCCCGSSFGTRSHADQATSHVLGS